MTHFTLDIAHGTDYLTHLKLNPETSILLDLIHDYFNVKGVDTSQPVPFGRHTYRELIAYVSQYQVQLAEDESASAETLNHEIDRLLDLAWVTSTHAFEDRPLFIFREQTGNPTPDEQTQANSQLIAGMFDHDDTEQALFEGEPIRFLSYLSDKTLDQLIDNYHNLCHTSLSTEIDADYTRILNERLIPERNHRIKKFIQNITL